MTKKKSDNSNKDSKDRKYITAEELQKMKFKLSIEVPKEDFDELLKAMMGRSESSPYNKPQK